MSTVGPGLPEETGPPGGVVPGDRPLAAPPAPAAPAGRAAIRWWLAPLLVTVLFLVLQPLLGSGWALFPDSYRYAKQAERILGADAEQAHLSALDAFCGSRADYSYRAAGTAGTWVARSMSPSARATDAATCVDKYAAAGDVTTLDPRYQSIFTTRPGYPLLAAPLIGAFGIERGMRLLGYLLAVAGGLATYALLRRARLAAVPAAVGQAVYLASPLGWWALQGLGEGLVDLCVLGAVAGLVLAGLHRTRAGLTVLGACWLALGVVRFSSLLLIATAMAAACLVLALIRRSGQRRPLFGAAAVCAAAAALTALAMSIFHLPGAAITLQDTFTQHFTEPLVPDPWARLVAANRDFWPSWLGTPSESWLLLASATAGAATLAIWRRDMLWPALALGAAGVAQIAAHPLTQEAGRLGLLMWIPAVFGAAVLAQALARPGRAAHEAAPPARRRTRRRGATAHR